MGQHIEPLTVYNRKNSINQIVWNWFFVRIRGIVLSGGFYLMELSIFFAEEQYGS